MASDGLLAAEKFLVAAISPHRVWMRYAVWALYYAAQLAITLGFLLGVGSFRLPARLGHLERGELEARRDGAADQRPFAQAARRLPPAGRHDDLRPLARRELSAEHLLDHGAVFLAHRQRQRGAGMEMPDLGGVLDPVPGRNLVLFQQEIDRGRMAARAAGAVAKGLGIPAAFRMRLQAEDRDDFGGAGH